MIPRAAGYVSAAGAAGYVSAAGAAGYVSAATTWSMAPVSRATSSGSTLG